MMRLFQMVKRWLIEYDKDLLDIFLPIKDELGKTHFEKYGEDFFVELNKHFTTQIYAAQNFYEHLPLLVLNIHDLGEGQINDCFHQYMLEFNYSFSSISLCQEKHLDNTPEGLYEFIDKVNCGLEYMMQVLPEQMEDIEDFHNLAYSIIALDIQPHKITDTSDEIITVNKQFIYTIKECG